MPALPGYKNAGGYRCYKGKRIKKIKSAPEEKLLGAPNNGYAAAVSDNTIFYTTTGTTTGELTNDVMVDASTVYIKTEDR